MRFSIIILTPTVVFMAIGSQLPVQVAGNLATCRSVGGRCFERGKPINSIDSGRVDEHFVCSGGQLCFIVGKRCEVHGDPHIVTYDTHYLNNDPTPIPHYSTLSYTGEFVLSRPWRKEPPFTGKFGAYANFIPRESNTSVTYASRFHYSQPEIDVELILPTNLFNTVNHCHGHKSTNTKCATKIKVNKQTKTISVNGAPEVFEGKDGGTVIIFRYGECNTGNVGGICTIVVVGSYGFVLRLDVEPWKNEYYNFFIYASPSLQNKLYGLCGTFTGDEPTSGYTPQTGTDITYFRNMNEFVGSWKVPI